MLVEVGASATSAGLIVNVSVFDTVEPRLSVTYVFAVAVPVANDAVIWNANVLEGDDVVVRRFALSVEPES